MKISDCRAFSPFKTLPINYTRLRADSNFLSFPFLSSDAANGFIHVKSMLEIQLSPVTQKRPSPFVFERPDGCTQAATQQ